METRRTNDIIIRQAKEAIEMIADEHGIDLAVLFGSRANGSYTDDSDVDLLVRFNSPRSLLQVARTQGQLMDMCDIPFDIVQLPLPKNSKLIIDADEVLYERKRSG